MTVIKNATSIIIICCHILWRLQLFTSQIVLIFALIYRMISLGITIVLAGTAVRNVTSVRFLICNVKSCSLVGRYQCFRAVWQPDYTNIALMEAKVSVKRWCCSTRLRSITYKEDSNVYENVISRKMQEVPLQDMSSTKDSNKGVCHVKLQFVFCLQFGKHTIREGT
jgi:hypothetical protein